MSASEAPSGSDLGRQTAVKTPHFKWLAPSLALLLAACGSKDVEPLARPVLVVQPGAAGLGVTAYAGEVRAREEPALGFRIGGKLSRRLVDVGDRVVAGQALAQLDASDVALQL